jgi:hypothetical protein
MSEAVDVQVSGLLAVTVAAQTVDALVNKGVLEQEEARQLYLRALGNLGDPVQRDQARRILNAIMPRLELEG